MKKIILTALNTRYTHSAIALGSLKAYYESVYKNQTLSIKEFDLNQTNEFIIASLIEARPDIIAFSVYIWSIERSMVIADALKTAFPEIVIIFGGPEVSYSAEKILKQSLCIDFIVRGEGEISFSELINHLLASDTASLAEGKEILGVTARLGEKILAYPDRPLIEDLDLLPCPVGSKSYLPSHSFVFYEASRGCPYSCSYCLSSVEGKVRNHSIERVKKDLDWFFTSELTQIRFADRTFNWEAPRAKEIIEYILEKNTNHKNFHFEIHADFLKSELIELFARGPEGMFHLEIGVQSTNPKALESVNRPHCLEGLRKNVKRLKKETKCHLHLDVLGGLEHDSFQDFCKSLDDVYELEPHDIQISLVKVLPGTPLAGRLKNKTFFAMNHPPYTILRTNWLSPFEAMMIQDMGKLVEGIINSKRYEGSINYLRELCFKGSIAKLSEGLVLFWRKNKIQFFGFTPENLQINLLKFASTLTMTHRELTKLRSMLEHEYRMCRRVITADIHSLVDFGEREKRYPFRVTGGIRGYWHESNPLASDARKDNEISIIVYKTNKDLSQAPSIEVISLEDEEAYAFMAVQAKASLERAEKGWAEYRPERAIPNIKENIEKLSKKGLIYESRYN